MGEKTPRIGRSASEVLQACSTCEAASLHRCWNSGLGGGKAAFDSAPGRIRPSVSTIHDRDFGLGFMMCSPFHSHTHSFVGCEDCCEPLESAVVPYPRRPGAEGQIPSDLLKGRPVGSFQGYDFLVSFIELPKCFPYGCCRGLLPRITGVLLLFLRHALCERQSSWNAAKIVGKFMPCYYPHPLREISLPRLVVWHLKGNVGYTRYRQILGFVVWEARGQKQTSQAGTEDLSELGERLFV